MLDELVVENLGIIERAHLQPGSGLVAFTGETEIAKVTVLSSRDQRMKLEVTPLDDAPVRFPYRKRKP